MNERTVYRGVVLKFTSDGTLSWAKKISATDVDDFHLKCWNIHPATNGYIIAGEMDFIDSGREYPILVKISLAGNLIFFKKPDYASSAVFPTSSNVQMAAISPAAISGCPPLTIISCRNLTASET